MKKVLTTDEKRSHTMSRIKSKDTSIELSLRKALWRAGIRYRKNYTNIPGTPDIAITKYKIAIFCDGEFWHGKDWESKKERIQNNREYWIDKIERNINRDNEVNRKICGNGWTVMRFWGNEIRDNVKGCVEDVQDAIFQYKISSNGGNSVICSLYPCELVNRHNEDSLNESGLVIYDKRNLPCFEALIEMPCLNQ